ncbi:unnamed protein product, partial [Mesorhabditis spiculigera]
MYGLVLLALVGTALAAESSPALILSPLVKQYQDLIYGEKYDQLENLYHPNAVLVVNGHAAPYYTPKNIFAQIKSSRSKVGSAKTTFLKESFTGAGEVLMYENQWKISTATSELTGPYRAIWVMHNGKWVIYHEEFSQAVKKL